MMSDMFRVCVCGGRNYFNRKRMHEVLSYVLSHHPDFMIVSGGCTGADTLAVEWAKQNDVYYEIYNANWKKYGKAAGPIRNRQMAESGIDVLLAFPGGKGTENMITECNDRKIKVVKIFDGDDA